MLVYQRVDWFGVHQHTRDILLASGHRRRGGEFGSFEREAKPAESAFSVIALPGWQNAVLYFCIIDCTVKLVVSMFLLSDILEDWLAED